MEIVLRITDLLHSVSTLNLHFPNKPSPYSHDKVAYFHHPSGPPRSATLATVVLSLESVETGEEDFLYNLVLMVVVVVVVVVAGFNWQCPVTV